MSPAIMFPDPRRAIRDRLRELMADRPESYAQGAVVSTKSPGANDTTRRLPHIEVRSDGSFRNAVLNGRATVRVLVYHEDDGLAHELASLCEALLIAHGNSAAVRSVSALVGPLPTDDNETGEPLSFFTITAYLRPIQLTR